MKKINRWIHLIFAGLLFTILHLISVRTGLMILYAGIFLASMILVLKKRSLLIGFTALFLMISTPYMAYKFIPGFNTKVHLTLHNIRLMQKGQVGPYSDTRRLLSYKMAWSIFKANPIFGVGIGDLKEEMALAYQQNYPSQKVMYPHNMFLTILAGMGLPALLIFMIAFSWPLLRWKNSGSLLFLFFYLSIGLSFLTENTLFRSMGLCTYAYFLFLILKLNQGDQES